MIVIATTITTHESSLIMDKAHPTHPIMVRARLYFWSSFKARRPTCVGGGGGGGFSLGGMQKAMGIEERLEGRLGRTHEEFSQAKSKKQHKDTHAPVMHGTRIADESKTEAHTRKPRVCRIRNTHDIFYIRRD